MRAAQFELAAKAELEQMAAAFVYREIITRKAKAAASHTGLCGRFRQRCSRHGPSRRRCLACRTLRMQRLASPRPPSEVLVLAT